MARPKPHQPNTASAPQVGGTLKAVSVSKSYGAASVLHDLTLMVGPGTRVGIIGPNGIGKSTLLRVLAGVEEPDRGQVLRSPTSITVGFLPQEPAFCDGEVVHDYIARLTGVAPAEDELDRITDTLSDDASPTVVEAYSAALDRYVALGGNDLPVRMRKTFARLDLSDEVADRPLASLSGGQLARTSLAVILLSRFDVLLLDEPTNNLDFAGIGFLEGFLAGFDRGLVVVSHDREFLRRIVNRVLEIEAGTHSALLFDGGWDAYLRERKEAQRHHEEAYGTYQAEKNRLEAALRRKREWAKMGASRAKTRARDNDKFIRKGRIESAENLGSGAQVLEHQLKRLNQVDKPWEPWKLQFVIGSTERAGTNVAQLRKAVVDRGAYRFGPVDLDVYWQDRIGIVGANGAGKTTMLGLLLGTIEPDTGHVQRGSGLVVGNIEQFRETFAGKTILLDVFRAESGLATEETRSLLAKFGLDETHVLRASDSLSPGERTRAGLALLMAHGVNTIVLDEPTNHLDLDAIEQLELALDQFDGTVLLVTHDRALLDQFRLTRLLEVIAEPDNDGVITGHVIERPADAVTDLLSPGLL